MEVNEMLSCEDLAVEGDQAKRSNEIQKRKLVR